MKKQKLLKYQDGNSIRRYYYRDVTEEDIKRGLKDWRTGKPFKIGDKIWVKDGHTNPVLASDENAVQDYLAEQGQFHGEADLPGLTITHNKNTGQTSTIVGNDFDDYVEAKENAPIATTTQREQIWQQQDEDQTSKEIEREADRRRIRKIGEQAQLAVATSPIWAPIAGLLGYSASTAPFATVASLWGAEKGAQAFDLLWSNAQTTPQQRLYGHRAPTWTESLISDGVSETLAPFLNPGGLVGGGTAFSAGRFAEQAYKEFTNSIMRGAENKVAQSILSKYNNDGIQFVPEVSAEEISSKPLYNLKKPLLYSKAGEVQKESLPAVLGNFQIKALGDNSPLLRSVRPDGTISMNAVREYIKSPNISDFDKEILNIVTRAHSSEPRISYAQLQADAKKLLPEFNATKGEGYESYGLAEIGYDPQGTDWDLEIGPDGSTRTTVTLESDKLPGDDKHFFDTTNGHFRVYQNPNEPGMIYLLENQSDWAQKIIASGNNSPMYNYIAETYFPRQLQQAMVYAHRQGANTIRIPTVETAAKIQRYHKGTKPLTDKMKQDVNLVYSEYVNTLGDLQDKYNVPTDYLSPETRSHIQQNYPDHAYLPYFQISQDFENTAPGKEYLKAYSKLLKDYNSKSSRARGENTWLSLDDRDVTPIISRYYKTPQTIKKLFGKEYEPKLITDDKGNTWFEAKIPDDIETRNLIFSKAGDTNEGSLTGTFGNYQLKSLQPGNPLQKRLSPNGTLSWKNFNWYLSQSNVSPYDRFHLREAVIGMDENQPINYQELLRRSQELIPKFKHSFTDTYHDYGLHNLKYGKDEVKKHPTMLLTSDGLIGSAKHFGNPDVLGHVRSFEVNDDPNSLYILESQSDKGQEILSSKVPVTWKLKHMAETFPQRQLQETLLHANALGKTQVKFPTSNTVVDIEGYPRVLTQEGKNLVKKTEQNYLLQALQIAKEKYPEFYRLYTIEQQIEQEIDDNNRQREILAQYINESLNSQNLEHFEGAIPSWVNANTMRNYIYRIKTDSPEIKNKLKALEDLCNKGVELLERSSKIDDEMQPFNEVVSEDKELLDLESRMNKEVYGIRKDYSTVDSRYNTILGRYDAFPRYFRNIFGSKAKVDLITDSKGNSWYNVDIPSDINTRSLIFNKVGDVNRGSLIGNGKWQIRSLMPGNPLEKRLSPNGTISWKNMEWYLKHSNVSAYDKWHMQEVLKAFPKEFPISYSRLVRNSQELIPNLKQEPVQDYSVYGLGRLGYNAAPFRRRPRRNEITPNAEEIGLPLEEHEALDLIPVIDPDAIAKTQLYKYDEMPLSYSHFGQGAFGHNRFFADRNDPNVLYVSEIQSDIGQRYPKAQSSYVDSPMLQHMSETFFPRQIQLAAIEGARAGRSKLRFPSRDTAARIEGFTKKISQNGRILIDQAEQTADRLIEDHIAKKYPDIAKLKGKSRWYNSLAHQCRAQIHDIRSKIEELTGTKIVASTPELLRTRNAYGNDPEVVKLFDQLESTRNQMLDYLQEDASLGFKIDKLEDSIYVNDKDVASIIEDRERKIREIKSTELDYPKEVQRVVDRYKSFPKQWRSLFGSKVTPTTDAFGNWWYEVDTPTDLDTRNLIFSTMGTLNIGSLTQAFQQAWQNLNSNNVDSYKKGSKIHIKKENRGKFTAAAKRAGMSVQAYASKVLNDPNASPQLKKRANFARNAKKWKH